LEIKRKTFTMLFITKALPSISLTNIILFLYPTKKNCNFIFLKRTYIAITLLITIKDPNLFVNQFLWII